MQIDTTTSTQLEASQPTDVLDFAYFGSGAGIPEFSNFAALPVPIKHEGLEFLTTEHAYQAFYRCEPESRHRFALPDGDLSSLEKGMPLLVNGGADLDKKLKFWGAKGKGKRPAMDGIVPKMAVKAKRAKKLGVVLRRFGDEPRDMQEIKTLFRALLRAKFRANEGSRKKLLDSGEKLLVEFDRGAGRETAKGNPPLFTAMVKDNKVLGQNLMGELMMEVRRELRSELE